MANNPSTLPDYNGQINPPDAAYPYGSARDDVSPGDLTGTPRVAAELKDLQGMQQALLLEAGIVPSGTADTATNSQYLEAIKAIPSLSGVQVYATVAALKAGTPNGGGSVNFATLAAKRAVVETVAYYDGWAALNEPPKGGAKRVILTATDYGATPDGYGDFYVGGGSDYVAVLIPEGFVRSTQFGVVGDGATIDSDAFVAFVTYCGSKGVIGDGENLPTRLTGTTTFSPSKAVYLRNINAISGTDYTDQAQLRFDTDVPYIFENIKVDGERNTRAAGSEPWTVFANFGGYDSISPLGVGRFIRILPYLTNPAALLNMEFNNCHYAACIEINSYALIYAENFKAKFCSNKTFHFQHGADGGAQPDSGVSIVNGYDARDCGIMVPSFLVDGSPTLRSDPYAPQGAFGAIVTYGRYIITGAYVNNYGATGITGDRNKSFQHSNIQIVHTDPNAFSNNPSGAMWNESCSRETGSGLEIKVTARDPRETAIDNSLLQIYLDNGEVSELANVILETEAGANINKVIRGSFGVGANCTINGYSVEATGSTSAIVMGNVTGQSNKVALHAGRVRGGSVEIRDSLDTTLTDLDSVGTLTIKPVVASPIGNVTLDNVQAGNTTVDGANGVIKVNNCDLGYFRQSQAFGSWYERLSIGGGTFLGGNSIINGGKSANFGDVETSRRVQFTDVERVVVAGGQYKTDVGEPILWFSPTAPGIMERASVMGAAIWIKTGTAGAGYTQFDANVGSSFDNGNDKANVAWT